MKKIARVIIAVCFILTFASIYVFANAGGNLSNHQTEVAQKNTGETEINADKQILAINDLLTEHLETLKENVDEGMGAFASTIHSANKQEIENYRIIYVSRLEDSKQELKERNMDDFAEEKEREIRAGIRQDVEDYLAELLNE
ncbi:hypothetical protein KFZ58_18590 [Virgibacillus sp. NKC19-16]|uniref:hypothetical protein n=1 Tax=Virgibacillus salidurans TaxID=2831673 RepID=UPI001F2C0271|nr:hypothetical protein [Virgibacillus sp. NKC19-16]UJL46327.1 hypothetical protein KFZ58_18590 [Virgibacillus sp. NKC19-16]